jgi:hypothetical protein
VSSPRRIITSCCSSETVPRTKGSIYWECLRSTSCSCCRACTRCRPDGAYPVANQPSRSQIWLRPDFLYRAGLVRLRPGWPARHRTRARPNCSPRPLVAAPHTSRAAARRPCANSGGRGVTIPLRLVTSARISTVPAISCVPLSPPPITVTSCGPLAFPPATWSTPGRVPSVILHLHATPSFVERPCHH